MLKLKCHCGEIEAEINTYLDPSTLSSSGFFNPANSVMPNTTPEMSNRPTHRKANTADILSMENVENCIKSPGPIIKVGMLTKLVG